jgi:ATP synthase I chain
MAEPDALYAVAEQRIEWLTLALGLAAFVLALVIWGVRSGAGVLLGAALAWLNFRWLKQGVNALVKISTAQSGSEHPRVPRSVYVKFFGRYALLLAVVYVILSRSWLPVAAVVGGLFAVVVAVMIELIWELLRYRRGTATHS